MLDAVRKYVEAGREALTPRKAESLARTLVRQGQARREQAGKLAHDLMEWSRRNSDRLTSTIRREVKKQIERSGVATKEEVEALKRRIRELERAGAAAGAGTASTAGKGGAGKPTGGKPTAATPKPTTAKPTTAKPSAATPPKATAAKPTGAAKPTARRRTTE
ncbi:MAG TPA: hypothetical protein VHL78_00160 [Actinomycetota bacterium]|nr:hypothetical protein [Actinomycetota bacterium]